MKLKLLVKICELILGSDYNEDEPRADMYLPIWLLAFALVLFVGGIVATIYAIVSLSVVPVVVALLCILLGIAALLCWKNQTINIISDDVFEYKTFLGNKKEYRFSDIVGIKQNSDSMTLFVGKDKVHIESAAVLSERLVERINEKISEIQ